MQEVFDAGGHQTPLYENLRVITFAVRKGGVNRTTAVLNLSFAMADAGLRVLMLDLDSQLDLTSMTPGIPNNAATIFDMFSSDDGRSLVDAAVSTSHPNVDLVPGDREISTFDIQIAAFKDDVRYRILRHYIKLSRVSERYDVVTIDIGPSMNGTTLNALIASTHYIVPICPAYYSVKNIELLESEIDAEVLEDNPGLASLGVFITSFDKRRRLDRTVRELVGRDLGDELLQTQIRSNQNFEEAASIQRSIFEYESATTVDRKRRRGRDDYAALAYEILEKLALTPNYMEIGNG